MSINEQAAQLGSLTANLPLGILDTYGNSSEGVDSLQQASQQITSLSEQVTAILGPGVHLEELRSWLQNAKDTVEHAVQMAQIAHEDARDAVALLQTTGELITATAQYHAR